MDLLVSGVNAAVIGVVGLLLAWMARGRFQALERRIDRVEESLTARIDRVEESLTARIDRLDGRLDRRIDGIQASNEALRSDLTQVALAVGVRRRATNP